MYENTLDGWLPVDKLGQILAFIFVLGLVVCMVVGAVGLIKQIKRYLKKKKKMEEEWCNRQEQLHNQEDKNWRQIPGALQKRINELEKTCKNNQETISNLKYEIEKKKQFMDQMKVSDLYKKWREEQDKTEYTIRYESN